MKSVFCFGEKNKEQVIYRQLAASAMYYPPIDAQPQFLKQFPTGWHI